jgi:KaiC/GvpD/RAD55 family RecA-like ATPase
MSKIVSIPDEIKVTPTEILVALAKTIPEGPKEQNKPYRGTGEQFDLRNWINNHGIRIQQEIPTSGAVKMILEECPFNSEHRGKDAALFLMNNGAIAFKCLHASCSNYNWQDVRKKFEPDAYDVKVQNRLEPRVNSQKPKEDLAPNEPFFYTATTVKPKDRSSIVSIRTGIRELDKKIIGLNKGEVTCLSGVNSSGKSSLLSQISLEVIQKGYRVALFSGELEENRVLNWIQLQAAGKQYTRPTQYEGFYTVDEEAKKYINKWLDDKLYIYNNRKGAKIKTITDSLAECIEKNKVDFIVLDNLMSMDLGDFSGDKYEQQSKFIKDIMAFARNNDVHVVLVAHPRKTIGFLRKTDIAGTADLTNAVDNVLIVHRVNNDFTNLSQAEFHWKDTDLHYACSNVIEVCKNRDLGIQDHFIDLFYEVESKRFLNERHEVRHYGFEDDMPCELPFE